MVFRTPSLRSDELSVLQLIDELRADLSQSVAEPRRWNGTLRKMSFARAVQGSNSIEGYDASLDDVLAAVDDQPTLDAGEETQHAIAGYRDAMTYVLQIADDEHLKIDQGLIKGLHFMMIKHDLSKNPGRWRPGSIYVRNEETQQVVYEGPDNDLVPSLIDEMVEDLASDDDRPVLVNAAMAHLNLVSIHPFSDGNGRMSRCLQTLVLARDRVVAPVFSSIEEFLGRNTQTYYDVLAEVQRGSWQPQNDARPWIRFCLRAHYLQARTVLRRRSEIEALWLACLELAEKDDLPERTAAALMEAAYGARIRRQNYRSTIESVTGDGVTDLTASRDLKAIVETGLFEAVGETRGRYYLLGNELKKLSDAIREQRPPKGMDDPFDLVRNGRQLSSEGNPSS